MKSWLLFCLVLALVACLASATRGSISNGLFQDDELDDVQQPEVDNEENNSGLNEQTRENPCHRKKCYRGETCKLNDNNEAECVCKQDCSMYRNGGERHKVCSSKNDTYESECDLDYDHCLCKRGLEGCSRPGTKKIHLEYYGTCRVTEKCEEHQMAQFPKRMREWLFIVMEVLERRAALGEYETLLEETKSDTNHSMAVIWKFCDLDKDPQDRFVSRRELQYTVRTLRALEHCLVPFLDNCDTDANREITLEEWGVCLGVDHDKISDRCVDIHQKGKKDKRRK